MPGSKSSGGLPPGAYCCDFGAAGCIVIFLKQMKGIRYDQGNEQVGGCVTGRRTGKNRRQNFYYPLHHASSPSFAFKKDGA
jgi:hypothetical protein